MTQTEPKVLKSLREQAASFTGACFRCGALIPWFNDVSDQPPDCFRCHTNGRLLERGCRARNCQRERTIDSGWRESGWPR